MNRLASAQIRVQKINAVPQCKIIILINCKLRIVEFHFTKIDNSIITLNYQINLRALIVTVASQGKC